MGREEGRRPKHEISCKVHELQEILAAANQLERFPDCKIKEALKVEIAEYLNPTEPVTHTRDGSLCVAFEGTKVRASTETSFSSKDGSDADWSPELKEKFFTRPTIAGMLLVALLLFGVLKQLFWS